jgi:tetratricopeptide (TPR) repeat protein
MEQDNKAGGLKSIEKAYQLMPDDPQIGALYSLALKMDKQPANAIKVAKTIAKLHPDNAALQVQVATLEMTVQQYSDALAILEDLQAKAPENLDPKQRSVLLFMLGDCYFYSGNYAKATEVLNEAISLTPRMVTANALVGEVYLKIGNIDLASTNLDEALAANPRYPSALFYKGICLEKSGKADLAQEYYLKAYQNQKPRLDDNGEDYFLMSLICQKIGKPDEASQNKDQAAKLLYTYEAPWKVK